MNSGSCSRISSSCNLSYWGHCFYVSHWRRDRHFTWPSQPREGLAVCRAKEVGIGPVKGIEPATSRSTDWADPAVACEQATKWSGAKKKLGECGLGETTTRPRSSIFFLAPLILGTCSQANPAALNKLWNLLILWNLQIQVKRANLPYC